MTKREDDTVSEAAPGAEEEEARAGESGALAPPRRVLMRRRAPSSERLYIVAYDIADQKRWRRVFRTMKGYGRWLQLSVFQCRLSGRRRVDLGAALERIINHKDDHVIILDLGLADEVDPRVESIGKSYTPITREAVIV
jgi:CRISPR-associated protein Cas2